MAQGDSSRPGSGMRKQSGTGSAALLNDEAAASRPAGSRKGAADTPDAQQSRPGASVYRPANDPLRPRRELVDHYADDEETEGILRGNGRGRRIRRGLIPQSRNGRFVAGVVASLCLGAVAAGAMQVSQYLSHSAKFRIPASKNIEIDGNTHLTRAQMLSVFGEDIDHNIFRVPMEQRRAQLEAMPWIEHATVMRLLPNRIRVHVEERVPIAFSRQGGTIGLVDANGVLLDVPPDAPGAYSFPVVAGLKAEESAAGRAERMKLYAAFLKDMDSDGKGASGQFSEIDLSDPEDVKALIPDGNTEVLVHFGTENFLARYRKYQDHIVEWRTQYPRLSSVDMRYERQVVLQMPQKDSTIVGPLAGESSASAKLAPLPSAKTPVHAIAASKPSPKPKAIVTAKSAHPATNATTKEAETRKRVEAIKAWMAKREKTRAATAAHSANAPTGQAN